MINVRSCCKLEAARRDQIPYLWLTVWQHQDHNTLWRFYQRCLRMLFGRTVRTAVAIQDLVERVEREIEDLEARNEGGDAAGPASLPEQLADQRA